MHGQQNIKIYLVESPNTCFHFPLSVFCLQCSTLIFILILFFSEGQAGEAWKVPKKAMLFRTWENIGKQSGFRFFLQASGN